MEEEQGRLTTMTPGVLRLFGVDVRWGDGGEPEELPMDMKKSSSMPNLTIHQPLLPPGEAGDGKGYASDDAELASGQQKRRRRKAQERKKGELYFFPPFSPSLGLPDSIDRSLSLFLFLSRTDDNPRMDGFQRKTLSLIGFRNQPVNIHYTHDTPEVLHLRASQRQFLQSRNILISTVN